MSQFVSNLRDQ